jgi:gas vesicle protein
MNRLVGVLLSAAVGAAAAYMLDPDRGRTRRARARDKAIAATSSMSDTFGGKSRHWSNVARGYLAEARNLIERGRRAAHDTAAHRQKPA